MNLVRVVGALCLWIIERSFNKCCSASCLYETNFCIGFFGIPPFMQNAVQKYVA
jgi:hypothetical protein